MTTGNKIKISDIKNNVRDEIMRHQKSLQSRLTEKKAIPRRIVDGSLNDVLDYKAAAEEANSIYHVFNSPSARMSLKKLIEVKDRLGKIVAVLE